MWLGWKMRLVRFGGWRRRPRPTSSPKRPKSSCGNLVPPRGSDACSTGTGLSAVRRGFSRSAQRSTRPPPNCASPQKGDRSQRYHHIHPCSKKPLDVAMRETCIPPVSHKVDAMFSHALHQAHSFRCPRVRVGTNDPEVRCLLPQTRQFANSQVLMPWESLY